MWNDSFISEYVETYKGSSTEGRYDFDTPVSTDDMDSTLTNYDVEGKAEPNIKDKILKYVEYYLGNYNVLRDNFLMEKIKENNGWIKLINMVHLKKLSSLTDDLQIICDALRQSELIEIDEINCQIRRSPSNPLPIIEVDLHPDNVEHTIYCKGFPTDDNVHLDSLMKFLRPYGPFVNFKKRYGFDETSQTHKFKGSILVVFPSVEAASKFMMVKNIKFKHYPLRRKWYATYLEEKRLETSDDRLDKMLKMEEEKEKSSRQRAPWWNEEIEEAILQKNEAYSRYMHSIGGDEMEERHENFKRKKGLVKRLVDKSKMSFGMYVKKSDRREARSKPENPSGSNEPPFTGVEFEAAEKLSRGRKTLPTGQRRTAWWNNEIKDAVKLKNEAFIRYMQSKGGDDEDKMKWEYKEAKLASKRMVIASKKRKSEHLGRQLANDPDDIKKIEAIAGRGAFLHLSGIPCKVSREEIRAAVNELTPHLAFVGYKRGEVDGYIRMHHENTNHLAYEDINGKLKVDGAVISVRFVDGDEEEEQLKLAIENLKKCYYMNASQKGQNESTGWDTIFSYKRRRQMEKELSPNE